MKAPSAGIAGAIGSVFKVDFVASRADNQAGASRRRFFSICTPMSNATPVSLPLSWTVRLLAILMTVVFSGLGLLALVNGYEPAQVTKLGAVGPLFDGAARHFGSSIFLFGLAPLMLLAHSRKAALWFGTSVMLLGMANLFFGSALWS